MPCESPASAARRPFAHLKLALATADRLCRQALKPLPSSCPARLASGRRCRAVLLQCAVVRRLGHASDCWTGSGLFRLVARLLRCALGVLGCEPTLPTQEFPQVCGSALR